MSAREVMAKAILDVGMNMGALAHLSGRSFEDKIVDFQIDALAAAGYRILAPGELDQESVERCAALAETYEHRTSAWQIDSIPWFAKGVATAIRSLGRRA